MLTCMLDYKSGMQTCWQQPVCRPCCNQKRNQENLHYAKLIFLQELQLHTWVENANIGQGIAPRSSILVHRASTHVPLETTRTLVRSGMKMKLKLQWLRRWRRRWNIGLGSIQPRDFLPVAECQKKVHEYYTICDQMVFPPQPLL